MVCFNNHFEDDCWGPSEWEFFLRDVLDNVLKPGGRLLLELNPERDGSFLSPDVEKVFARAGASVRGAMVRLPA